MQRYSCNDLKGEGCVAQRMQFQKHVRNILSRFIRSSSSSYSGTVQKQRETSYFKIYERSSNTNLYKLFR